MKRLNWRRFISRFLPEERGQTLYQTALFLPLLMMCLGLVVDGGLMFANYRRAQIAADTAAHAASHRVSREVFYDSNAVALAWEQAVFAARDYAEYNSRGGMAIRQVTVGPNWVRVEADAILPTIFLRFVGVSEVKARVVGEAYPAYGIDVEGQ
jgi:Flp pilus assembly protein TadG